MKNVNLLELIDAAFNRTLYDRVKMDEEVDLR